MDKTQKRLLREWLQSYWTTAARDKFPIPHHIIERNFEELTADNTNFTIHWIIHPRLQTFAGFISHQKVVSTGKKTAIILDKVFIESSYNNQNLDAQALGDLIDHWRKNLFESITLRIYDEFTYLSGIVSSLGFQKTNALDDMSLGRRLKLNEWYYDLKSQPVNERKRRT